MSWYVEGRAYHDYGEYQQALAQAEANRARNAASELLRANEAIAEDIRRDRAALDRVGVSLEEQLVLSRRIAANVQNLSRNQSRLEQVITDVDGRLTQGLADLERELAAQNGELHGVQVDLGTLRQNHDRHVGQVRRDLADVRGRLETGLAEAEAQRRATEKRLKAAVAEVDDKIETDRQTRLNRQSDQRALAETELDAAVSGLAALKPEAERLDLGADIRQTQSAVQSARTLLLQGNVSSALATAASARSQADSLSHEALLRSADLKAASDGVRMRVSAIQSRIGDGASADLMACYGSELLAVALRLVSAQERLSSRYLNYRLFDIERREDGQLLDEAEAQVLDMVARAPVVAEAASRRARQLAAVLDELENVLGEAGEVSQTFAVIGDPKSDLIADVEFGSSSARLRLTLDGKLTLDGHRYDSNDACSNAAAHVLDALRRSVLVQSNETDTTGAARSTTIEERARGQRVRGQQ